MNIFEKPRNAKISLISARALDDNDSDAVLPRDCPPLGVFGAFDMPDTLGLGGSLETEADLQNVLERLDEMNEDEFIIVRLPEMVDFYMLLVGTNPAE